MSIVTLDELREKDRIAAVKTKWGEFCFLKNDFIGKKMINEGHFEDIFIQVLIKYINLGDTVIDIGANIGCYTIPFGKTVGHTGKVIAFEPQSILYSILESNCQANKLQDNIELHQVAVGHNNIDVRMDNFNNELEYISDRMTNFGGLSLGKNGESIKMISLDSRLDQIDKVKLIKIDVEGAERMVVFGAQKLISRDRPIIFWEKNYKTITPEMMELEGMNDEIANFVIVEFLQKLGYSFYWQGDNILGLPIGMIF